MKIPRSFLVFFALLLASSVAYAAGENPTTHKMMELVTELGIVLFAAKLGSLLFERLRLPGVLGEIAAGVLISSHQLGKIPLPGFPNGIFPEPPAGALPVSDELYGICSLASIVLLFTVGLETDLRLLRRYTLAGLAVGLGGVIGSFVLGDLAAVAFFRWIVHEPVTFLTPKCMFMGVISTATSVGITARILSERRKLDSPEGVTILAGAVIDDVLGIIVLAITLGVIAAERDGGRSVDWAEIGLIGFKAVTIWLAATALGLLASRRISAFLKRFRDQTTISIMALGLALIVAGAFEQADLAMIIGAYVMGLALSCTDINHLIRQKLSPLCDFLVPVFFCVMGMLIDLRSMASFHVLLFGCVYTLLAIVAKVAGCGLPAMLFGFNLWGGIRVGTGMLPRGEIALIMAGIGTAHHIIADEVVGVSLMMMMVTTLLAPPVLVKLFAHPTPGTKKPIPGGKETVISFRFPSEEVATFVVERILRTFEAEGFYVHLLDREEQVYQFRKDDMRIGFHHAGEEVFFYVMEEQSHLVHTAMWVVVVELHATIAGLKKPIDDQSIARALQPDRIHPWAEDLTQRKIGKLGLANFITPAVLNPSLKATTKEEVIEELLQLAAQSGHIKDLDAARAAVWERESSMSTGMQHGVAIPHGRTDAVDRLVCAIGLKKEGIDFGSLDGEPTKIFVLTLSPARTPAPHVQFMSTITQILDQEGRAILLACETPGGMYKILVGASGA